MALLFVSVAILASCVHNVVGSCRFEPQNATFVRDKVSEILEESGAKLIRYNAVFVDYTDSVLTEAGGDLFRPKQWIRTVNRQGNNLLMFDDNFEMLSLGLLSIGLYNVDLKLVDVPRGCINSLGAAERIGQMRALLLTDFRNATTRQVNEENFVFERICNKRVFVVPGDRGAEFAYKCCHRDGQGALQCADIVRDTWIVVLDYILGVAIIIFMLYCPKLLSIVIGEQRFRSDEVTTFTARLPENSASPVQVVKEVDEIYINNGRSKLSLDGMEKVNKYLTSLGDHTAATCRIVDMTVSVPRDSLFPLGCYPVSIFRVLYDGIFHCRFGRSATFNPCCSALVCCKRNIEACQCKWISFFRIVGKLLLLLLFCVPFIIEFVVYYLYITPMIDEERAVCDKINTTCLEHKKGLDLLGVRYLSKFSIAIYAVIAFVSGLIVEFVIGRFLNRTAVFSTLLIKSQTEMRIFPIIRVLVHTILTPFKEHGLLGFLLFPIYIPKIFWYLIYTFLAIFPLVKIIFGLLQFIIKITYNKYKGKKPLWRIIIEAVLCLIIYYVFLASLLVLVIFCVTFYTEIFFYTLIGIIANANQTLPFVTMLLPLGVYTRQILGKVGEVYKQFLSLISQIILSRNADENGDLGRLDLERYKRNLLMLKSFSTDPSADVVKSLTTGEESAKEVYYEGNWMLLFLEKAKDSDNAISTDSEIPVNLESKNPKKKKVMELVLPSRKSFQKHIRKPHYELGKYYIYTPADLFYDTVDLDLPGSPGPIRSVILKAFLRLFAVIGFLAFVVIAVMGLGASYKITLTDQLMLTVVGGVVPLIFRYGLFNYRMSSIDWDNEELKLNVIKAMSLWTERWKIVDMTLLSSGSEITSPDHVEVDLAPKPASEDGHDIDEGDELYKKPDDPKGAVYIPMNDLEKSTPPPV